MIRRGWHRVRAVLFKGTFEIPVAAYVTFLGLTGIVSAGAAVPRSVETALPAWLVVAWSVALAVGGVFTLAGVGWSRDRLESAGLGFIISGNVIYCAVLVAEARWPSALAAFLAMLAIAVGAFLQIRRLVADREALKIAQQIKDGGDE